MVVASMKRVETSYFTFDATYQKWWHDYILDSSCLSILMKSERFYMRVEMDPVFIKCKSSSFSYQQCFQNEKR